MIQNQFEHLFGQFHTMSIGDKGEPDLHCISYFQNHTFRMIPKSLSKTRQNQTENLKHKIIFNITFKNQKNQNSLYCID